MAALVGKSVAIVLNLFTFIATIIFNKEATTISKLFPRKTGEVSNRHKTEITPAAGTFAIWGLIYLFQFSWIIYSVSLLFRPAAADILPTSFYLFYTFSCVLNISWLIVWARDMFGLSSAILGLFTFSLQMCLLLSYASLHEYLQNVPRGLQNHTDIWCVRFLVQNGVMFYTAWVTIATCINFTIYMQDELHIHKTKAAAISLVILLSLVIVWFGLENMVFAEYTRYTSSEYIVLLIGLGGILKKQWTDGQGNQAFVLVIFIISGLMFGARIMIITATEGVSAKQK